MTYVKAGAFDSDLRLLLSRFDGTVFPPLTDVTESIDLSRDFGFFIGRLDSTGVNTPVADYSQGVGAPQDETSVSDFGPARGPKGKSGPPRGPSI